MNKLTCLQFGWLFSIAHFFLSYLLSRLHPLCFPNYDLAFIESQIGLIKWMEWKGLNGPTLDAYAFYSLLLTPLSVAGWHCFIIDARPRRPNPTIRSGLFFLAYLLPIVAFFHHQYEPKGERSTFKSPLLKVIANSDALTSLIFSSSVWLVVGLAYLAILPIFELALCKHKRTNK